MHLRYAESMVPGAALVSAATGQGLENVRERIREKLFKEPCRLAMRIPVRFSGKLSDVRGKSSVLKETWTEEFVAVEIETSRRNAQAFLSDGWELLGWLSGGEGEARSRP